MAWLLLFLAGLFEIGWALGSVLEDGSGMQLFRTMVKAAADT